MAVHVCDDYFMCTLSDMESFYLFLYFIIQGIYKKSIYKVIQFHQFLMIIIVCDVEKHKISFLPSLYCIVYP